MTMDNMGHDAPKAKIVPQEPPRLEYNGVLIHRWDEMLSLTDMWKAAGSDPAQRPSDWLASADAQKFVDVLGEVLTTGISGSKLVLTKEGRGGGTRAHWQIGLAYAKYLSPEFHMWCNTVVRERMEGHPVAIPHDAVGLSDEGRRAIGGIAKAVIGKALDDRLSPLETGLAELRSAVNEVMKSFDPASAMVTDYQPMLQILVAEGVESKKRRQLSQRCSSRCRRYLTGQGRGDKVRLSRETGRLIFHLDGVREWLDLEGRELIRQHRDRLSGQSILAFPSPKKGDR